MSSVADLTATQRSGELQSASELHWEGGRGRQILSVSLAPSVVEISVGSQMKLPSSEQSTGRSQGWAHWSSTQRFEAQSASALHASPSSPPSASSQVILMGEAERSTRQTSPWAQSAFAPHVVPGEVVSPVESCETESSEVVSSDVVSVEVVSSPASWLAIISLRPVSSPAQAARSPKTIIIKKNRPKFRIICSHQIG